MISYPLQQNIDLEQGIDSVTTFTYVDPITNLPIDLSGYLASFTMVDQTISQRVLLTLYNTNGGITLGGATGLVSVNFSSVTTSGLDSPIGLYDLVLISPLGNKIDLATGFITVSAVISSLLFPGAQSITDPLVTVPYSYQAPVSGFSVTFPNNVSTLLLEPAGTLISGSVALPSLPVDGQVSYIISTQTVSAITFTSSKSIVGTKPSLSAGVVTKFIYIGLTNKWYLES